MRGVTNGQRLLVESGASLGSVARACGVSRPTAQRWKRGESGPRDAARASLQDAFGIDIEAWDVALPAGFEIAVPPPARTGRPKKVVVPKSAETKSVPKSVSPAQRSLPPPYPDPPPIDASIVANLRYSLVCIRHDMRHGGLTASARSRMRSDEARILASIAKLQREEELSEDRYVKNHPAFKRHCDKILAALKSYPKAAKAVAAALRS